MRALSDRARGWLGLSILWLGVAVVALIVRFVPGRTLAQIAVGAILAALAWVLSYAAYMIGKTWNEPRGDD